MDDKRSWGLLTQALDVSPGEGSPIPFYEKIGFALTGEEDEDGELIKRYELSPAP